MIEIIRASFFAGEVKTFLIQGEYVEILEAAYPIDVAMMDRSGAQLSTMRNAEASYFSRPGKYEVIQVTSSAAQTVRLFVGSGDAGTRRTSGDVSVIDGGKNRSMGGKTFSGAMYSPSAAASFANCQIYNPVGSGINLIVEKIAMGSATAQQIRWGHSLGSIGGTSNSLTSKKTNQAAAICQAMINNLPGLAAGFLYLGQLNVQANNSFLYDLREPVIITPGYGFVVSAQVAVTDINATIEFFEEVI